MISQKNSAVACIGRIGRSVLFASFCPIILVEAEIVHDAQRRWYLSADLHFLPFFA
jgi:hypothetical protein